MEGKGEEHGWFISFQAWFINQTVRVPGRVREHSTARSKSEGFYVASSALAYLKHIGGSREF